MRRLRVTAAALVIMLLPLAARAAAKTVVAPKPIAEMMIRAQPSLPKWFPDKPLFGDYVASGDGSGSGALAGHIVWDLYEEERKTRHISWFRGFVERDGQRYPFEITGVYTPLTADRRRWQLSGAIAFDDDHLLGTSYATITGTFEADTVSAHYTVWVDRDSH